MIYNKFHLTNLQFLRKYFFFKRKNQELHGSAIVRTSVHGVTFNASPWENKRISISITDKMLERKLKSRETLFTCRSQSNTGYQFT